MKPIKQPAHRLFSLDVMRGLVMILLAGESVRLYDSLQDLQPAGFSAVLITQFFHHPWHGLRLWDLIQPAFMLMAGTAMYISYHFKTEKGITWKDDLRHIAVRCFKLFLLGTGLQCVYSGKLVWELWNVLAQLSVTTMIAYLIIRKSYSFQIIFSVILLIITELLYRFILMPGYDEPFVLGKNFGSYMDMVLMHKINPEGWVAINFLPTAAHTIWGVLAGKLLISKTSASYKIKALVIAGMIGLFVGFGLDFLNITPIIKRISTSSFVFASGGWVLLLLAFLYWLTDVKKINRYVWVFAVVGMNSIFIYLFLNTAGSHFFNGFTAIFVKGFSGLAGAPENIQAILSALVTLFLEWSLCYWLYARKIFFKL